MRQLINALVLDSEFVHCDFCNEEKRCFFNPNNSYPLYKHTRAGYEKDYEIGFFTGVKNVYTPIEEDRFRKSGRQHIYICKDCAKQITKF